jgi:uncharacterized small protein (DUF1192 family)
MGERRVSRRQKSFLHGQVFVSRKQGALSCLIRDFSETGARLIFSDTVALPGVFDLYIPQQDRTLRAHVRWRRRDEIGLRFVAAEPAPAAALGPDETAQRIAALEAEIATLRALVRRLRRDQTRSGDAAA